MSFILDALRKSELERQRDAAARIMRLPVAQREGAQVPGWLIALIAVLAVSVLVLAGTAWRGWHERATVAAEAAPRAPAPRRSLEAQQSRVKARQESATTAAPRPGSAVTAAPRPGAATASAAERRAGQTTAPVRRKPANISPAGGAADAASAKRAAQARRPAAAPTPPANPAALPSSEELAADGVQIPPLTLQLHVYSKSPSQRFVFINGTRYQEGQKTEEGPVLVSVTPKGAVLSQSGHEFFVPTQ